jgi:streptogramin lyase
LRLPSDELDAASSEVSTVTPDVVFTGGSVENQDLAFDVDGNLWVADDGLVVRYDADRLDADDEDPPDVALLLRNASDSQDIGVDHLTFDADGNLWCTDFGGNFVARIGSSDLDTTSDATVVAEVSLVLSISALLNRPAFDDAGGLWISYSAGRVARIAPAALEISTGAGDPTVPDRILEGGDVANTANLAFFPAAAGLPLYSSSP